MKLYSPGPKIITQNYFPIYFNAFSCLQECLYCVISRLNSNNFIVVIKLNNRCMHCTLKIKFQIGIVQIQQFKFLQNFENATFLLTSMVMLYKIVKIDLANCLNICSFSMNIFISQIDTYKYINFKHYKYDLNES